MSNKEMYNQAFVKAMDVQLSDLEKLEYQSVPTWDSVGHMGLISELEDTFDIELETDDIVDFNSYAKGIVILKKYGVEIC